MNEFTVQFDVDPTDCTIYARTDVELQAFLAFSICVAGKTARVVQRQLRNFWMRAVEEFGYDEPFALLRRMSLEGIRERLRLCGIGCFTIKGSGLFSISRSCPNLRECTPADLEAFPGIGPKTSRFFILHSRKDAQVACLDTHILRWLREHGVPTPKSTPQGRKYRELEEAFIRLVPPGKTIAGLDLEIWNQYSRKISPKVVS